MGTGTPARLILLNGPPGVGKSTLARRFAESHPLTLALEIDGIRAMLGAWLDAPQDSGLTARRLALVMADAHLREGKDVIVPQLLTRREFVEQLRTTALDAGAAFRELVVLDDRAAVLERAYARDEPAGGFSARALVARQGNSLEEAYDAFVESVAPDAEVIDASSPDDAYAELERLLA